MEVSTDQQDRDSLKGCIVLRATGFLSCKRLKSKEDRF